MRPTELDVPRLDRAEQSGPAASKSATGSSSASCDAGILEATRDRHQPITAPGARDNLALALGENGAGRDRVDPDAVRPQRPGERIGEADDRRLGNEIRTLRPPVVVKGSSVRLRIPRPNRILSRVSVGFSVLVEGEAVVSAPPAACYFECRGSGRRFTLVQNPWPGDPGSRIVKANVGLGRHLDNAQLHRVQSPIEF
jgi:hypothetical protein